MKELKIETSESRITENKVLLTWNTSYKIHRFHDDNRMLMQKKKKTKQKNLLKLLHENPKLKYTREE